MGAVHLYYNHLSRLTAFLGRKWEKPYKVELREGVIRRRKGRLVMMKLGIRNRSATVAIIGAEGCITIAEQKEICLVGHLVNEDPAVCLLAANGCFHMLCAFSLYIKMSSCYGSVLVTEELCSNPWPVRSLSVSYYHSDLLCPASLVGLLL